MAIEVVNSNHGFRQNQTGEFIRRRSLAITGLTTNSDNTVPHGLPFIPRRFSYRPGPESLWGEQAAPDATNIYIHVLANGATAGSVDYEE